MHVNNLPICSLKVQNFPFPLKAPKILFTFLFHFYVRHKCLMQKQTYWQNETLLIILGHWLFTSRWLNSSLEKASTDLNILVLLSLYFFSVMFSLLLIYSAVDYLYQFQLNVLLLFDSFKQKSNNELFKWKHNKRA